MDLRLRPPEALSPGHKIGDFGCGEPQLDDWLRRRALANQLSGGSRTFVVTDGGGQVFGYYALAAGAVSHREATGSVRRNMPEPVPVMVLARLAVDRRAQGMRLGPALLQDAFERCVAVSRNTGVRAILVHALHHRARQFYEHYGFQVSPLHPLTLMVRLR